MLTPRTHIRNHRAHNARVAYNTQGAQGPMHVQHAAKTKGMIKQEQANVDYIQRGNTSPKPRASK